MLKGLGQLGDMAKLMKQAQDMQSKMTDIQKQLEELEVEGESGGGLIKAIVNAKGTLKSLNVDESLFVPSEKAVVEDLIVAAIRDAQKKSGDKAKEEMAKVTSDLNLPAGFKLPFLKYINFYSNMNFKNHKVNDELETLIAILSKLPGLGPRSARRAVIKMIEKKEIILEPLTKVLNEISEKIKECESCGNFTVDNICSICSDNSRNNNRICIVQDVADLWAMERSQVFDGLYHVLGNYSSSYLGINLEELEIDKIINKIERNEVKEIILALDATINGQTTANYIIEKLKNYQINFSSLAHGVPVGGELDYLDDGTIRAAFSARKPVL